MAYIKKQARVNRIRYFESEMPDGWIIPAVLERFATCSTKALTLLSGCHLDLMNNILKLLLLFILISLTGVRHDPAAAQEPDYWSPAQRIPGYLDDTLPPVMIADQNQTVHAFASQWIDTSETNVAIVYRTWNKNTGWTPPEDIILPKTTQTSIQGAILDKSGTVHLIYWSGDVNQAGVYYTHAPLTDAAQSQAWSEPRLVGPDATEPALAALSGDGDGRLLVLYRGNPSGGSGLYTAHSADGGQNWTEPSAFYLSPGADSTPAYLAVTHSDPNQVHVAWSLTTRVGRAISAYYARYDIRTGAWSSPTLLAEETLGDIGAGIFGPTYPAIIAVKNRVVLLYNANGGPDTLGRPTLWMRISEDNGNTWAEPSRPWPNHVGLNGMFSLAVDGSGRIHAVFIQRIERTINGSNSPYGGMWHSILAGDEWTAPARIDQKRVSTYDVRAVISQGNLLLATWREDPGFSGQGVFYSYTGLDSESLPVMPLPTQASLEIELTEPISAVLPIAGTSGDNPADLPKLQAPTPAGLFSQNPTYLVLLGLIPTMLIIGIFIIVRNRTI